MNKFLLLDLDDTLVTTTYANSAEHAEEIRAKHSYKSCQFFYNNSYWMVSFERPWAKQLIEHYTSLLGWDNVGILSFGENRYVQKVSQELGFWINPAMTYGREDLNSRCPKFKGSNNVLVDNENYDYHLEGLGHYGSKIKFLHGLPPEKLVQVPNFELVPSVEDIKLEKLIEKIEKAFDFEKNSGKLETVLEKIYENKNNRK